MTWIRWQRCISIPSAANSPSERRVRERTARLGGGAGDLQNDRYAVKWALLLAFAATFGCRKTPERVPAVPTPGATSTSGDAMAQSDDDDEDDDDAYPTSGGQTSQSTTQPGTTAEPGSAASTAPQQTTGEMGTSGPMAESSDSGSDTGSGSSSGSSTGTGSSSSGYY